MIDRFERAGIQRAIAYFEARLVSLEHERSAIIDELVNLTLQLKEPTNAQEDREEEPKDATT